VPGASQAPQPRAPVHVCVLRKTPARFPQPCRGFSSAASLGVKLLVRDIRSPDDLPTAFDSSAADGIEGVLTTAESIFAAQAKRVVQLATQHRLPGMFPTEQWLTPVV
jgi:hypothetical protein